MKRIPALILCAVLVLSLTACTGIGEKKYTSSYTAYVNRSDTKNSLSNDSTGTPEDTPEQLTTYTHILMSNVVLESICDYLEAYSEEELQQMIKVEVIEGSNTLLITVTADDPQDAFIIADTHAKIAPNRLGNIIEGVSMKIIDYPKLSPD